MTDDTVYYCPCCDTPMEVEWREDDSGAWTMYAWCHLCEAGWPSTRGKTKAESIRRMFAFIAAYLPGSNRAPYRDAYVSTLAEIEADMEKAGRIR